ncbi:MAG: DUF4386 family protein [Acidobacteria bacterium]|nr:DUF4386 family protein [Acidobacteriota bacterium]MBV9622514.1 DUF4386 family protein [Acidobacteriota bacterium]
MTIASKVRVAGLSYLLALVTAIVGEFLIGGKLGVGVALIAVPCYLAVTLLAFTIFAPVRRRLCLIGVSLNFLGLGFEAVRFNPWGVDIALVFHGLYCLMIGYVVFRALFVPRALGLPMVFAGLAWLVFLSPRFAAYLSPWNLDLGILGEAVLMVWLLVFGVDVQRWKEQSGLASVRV